MPFSHRDFASSREIRPCRISREDAKPGNHDCRPQVWSCDEVRISPDGGASAHASWGRGPGWDAGPGVKAEWCDEKHPAGFAASYPNAHPLHYWRHRSSAAWWPLMSMYNLQMFHLFPSFSRQDLNHFCLSNHSRRYGMNFRQLPDID